MSCPNCGGDVAAKRVGEVGQAKTYCSIRCRSAYQKRRESGGAESWDPAPKPCGQCGALFTPAVPHHTYCSRACRRKRENKARFGKSGSNSNYYRSAFIEERGGICQDCGVPDGLQIHHIVGVAAGGPHKAANLRVLCESCHEAEHPQGKAARSPEPEPDKWAPSPWQRATQRPYAEQKT
jgi:5-methylcytosine-specific restriction endonuclease McrA